MRALYKAIANADRKKRLAVGLAFFCNTILVAFFVMMVTGLENVTNETLSSNDKEQLLLAITSIISIGIIAIFFLQWIVSSLYSALFESRTHFNRTMRMIGMAKKSLFGIYVREFITLQGYILPGGIIFSVVFYTLIAKMIGIPVTTISSLSIVLAVAINFVTSFGSLLVCYRKNMEPIESHQRGNSKIIKHKVSRTWYVLKTIFGAILMALFVYFSLTSTGVPYHYIFVSLPILCLYETILKLLCKVLDMIIPARYHNVVNLIKGNLKSIQVISATILLGIALVFGMSAMIITSRNMAYNQVIEGIQYDKVVIAENFFEDNQSIGSKESINTALFLKAKKVDSSNVGLMGIDGDYIGKFEKFEMQYITHNEFVKNFDNPDWNGIIFPNLFVRERDIGSTITLDIEGKQIQFKVVGTYYPNDFSTLFAYANKSYISKALNIGDKANIQFIKGNTVIGGLEFLDDTRILTKEDVAKESYKKVVQSTSILEVTVAIILISSFFMLINYVYMSAGKSRLDIARMRCIGVSGETNDKIYIIHYIFVVLVASVLGIVGAYLFGTGLCYMFFGERYVEGGIIFPWIKSMAIIILYIVIILIDYYILTQKVMRNYLDLVKMRIQEN